MPTRRPHWLKLESKSGYNLPGIADLVKVGKRWWLCRPGFEPVDMGTRGTFDDAEALLAGAT
jgi:hypothetical protein